MTYWRKFFIVVLLALSLPVQSLAAVSIDCATASVEHDVSPRQLALHEAVVHAGGDDVLHHESAHAHSSAASTPCCSFGIGLPLAAPTVLMPPEATRVIERISPTPGAVSFLTGGIERPPRRITLA